MGGGDFGIHYSDAILTVIFTGGILFVCWSIREFMRLNLAIERHAKKSSKQLAKLQRKLTTQIIAANAEGAKIVRDHFNALIEGNKK